MTVIEVSAVLIGLYLVLTNADSFKTVSGAVGSVYTGAVGALQGPKKNG
ncbi:MAG TPA: hypothetical protein VGE97_09750 [Nitrososphaera sp.]